MKPKKVKKRLWYLLHEIEKLDDRLRDQEKVARPPSAHKGWKWVPIRAMPDGSIHWAYVPEEYTGAQLGFDT